jgi:hypothetical protein
MVNHYRRTTMIQDILERLAEMFPKQNYQSRLDAYVTSKNPQNAAEVDMWIRDYETHNNGWAK